ncbi:hypothetical protein [Clostridium baratii]|uniref:hypothetical protein n=1 Tax=Clostridium baratii TaxID=1561 RepID=UPI00097FB625|nr:hypothetical protein [Clostridium baratii]AQM60067.1 hypothetical protein NPD11_433 [Clostridium baratii]
MEKHELLIRAQQCLNDLCEEIEGEEWGYNEELFTKETGELSIVTNLIVVMLRYKYNKDITKDEIKNFVCESIDKYL